MKLECACARLKKFCEPPCVDIPNGKICEFLTVVSHGANIEYIGYMDNLQKGQIDDRECPPLPSCTHRVIKKTACKLSCD